MQSSFDLTIGIATYDDWHGTFFTIESLFLHHDLRRLRAEVLLVDNHPDGPWAESFRHYAAMKEQTGRFRYVAMPEPVGTSPPRDRIFAEARGEVVCVLDCHILLAPGSLGRILDFFDQEPGPALAHGVYLVEDGRGFMTHFNDEWGAHMWGRWAADPRGQSPDAAPFEIPASGLGAFACRRSDWPGFNPLARGFGGEEWYIHEKLRGRGGKVWCLPGFRLIHRFHDQVSPLPYPNLLRDRARNYLLEFLELGIDPGRMRRHFVDETHAFSPEEFAELEIRAQEEWTRFLANSQPAIEKSNAGMPAPAIAPSSEPANVQSVSIPAGSAPAAPGKPCRPCSAGRGRLRFATVHDWLAFERQTAPQLSAMGDALRQATRGETHVMHLWAGPTMAAHLLSEHRESYKIIAPRQAIEDWIGQAVAVQPPRSVSAVLLDPLESPAGILDHACAVVECGRAGEALTAAGPQPMLDLLNKLDRCRRIIILGPDRGEAPRVESPIRAAIREFGERSPGWRTISYVRGQWGIAVLARAEGLRDGGKRPRLPGILRQAVRFLWALARHLGYGAKKAPAEWVQARLEICRRCDQRMIVAGRERCGVCGCFLTGGPAGLGGKTEWPRERCPLGKWHSVPVPQTKAA